MQVHAKVREELREGIGRIASNYQWLGWSVNGQASLWGRETG